MTVSNRYVRQLEEQRSQDLATLAQLSRDLDAHLKGKQTVKTKVPAKYVGVTNAQGDSQYQTNLTRFGAKNLGRAFGVNMSLQELHDDTRTTIAASLGSGSGLRDYVDLCTQVVIHEIAQAAARMTSAQSNQLALAHAHLIGQLTGAGSRAGRASGNLIDALNSLNGLANFTTSGGGTVANTLFNGRVFSYLAPINRGYVEALVAINLAKIEARSDMLDYIATPDAQTAVSSYLVKKRPSSDVLLPGSIRAVVDPRPSTATPLTARERVDLAFQQNPGKDVVATFKYYQAAVGSELNQSTGIRTGDVAASLKAATVALNDAASAMAVTGIAQRQARIFQDGFRKIAKQVGSLKADGLDIQEIAFPLADLFDLLGAYTGIGSGSLSGNSIANAFTGSAASALEAEVVEILENIPSAYSTVGSGLAQQDIAFLDAQDELRPADVNTVERRKPNLAAVRNNLSLAIMSLNDAASEISVGLATTISRPSLGVGLTATPSLTPEFQRLVRQNLNSLQTRFRSIHSPAGGSPSVDPDVYARGVNEAYAEILGVTTTNVVGGPYSVVNPMTVANDSLQADANDWIITDARFEQIADGRIPNLNSRSADGRTIEQVLISFVDREFANAGRVAASVRRATRDAVLQSAQLLVNVLDGVRIEAENIGMVIRQNPMGGDMSGLAITGAVTASLVGTHALSALTNRFVSPKHGTVMSHVADLAPSLAVIGTGVYLASAKDQKDLGYSLAGGAAGHLALRYLMKHVPALRFSENIGAKILQAPTNGLAHLLGDDTMGASGLTPANAQSHKKDIAEYVCSLVCENSKAALNYIAIQLWQSGLRVEAVECVADGVKAAFKVEAASKLTRDKIKDDAAACGQIGKICNALAQLKYACDQNCTFECKAGGVHAKCKLTEAQVTACQKCATECATECAKILGCKSAAALESDGAASGSVAELAAQVDTMLGEIMRENRSDLPDNAAIQALLAKLKAAMDKHGIKQENLDSKDAVEAIGAAKLKALIEDLKPLMPPKSNPMRMHGFILEPGYDMDVYSGEDQVSYLQPAPQMTAQSGFVQLEDAIARSEELGPHDKMMEGIGDLQDVAILRASPSDARMIEGSGMGVSLGQSRQNPSAELVALEVEGDNGLMSVAPQRQHSVPQGALNYAKIGHASNVDVSPHGLFNRGAFNPNFGR